MWESEKRADRLKRLERVLELRTAGWQNKMVAKELGISVCYASRLAKELRDAGHDIPDGRRDPRTRADMWTSEEILERFRAWAQTHGGHAPREDDWHPGSRGVHPDFERGTWPSCMPVKKRFGTFADAASAAGLVLRPRKTVQHVVLVCPMCGLAREVPPSSALGKGYCGRRCAGAARSAASREALRERHELIVDLRRQGLNNREIGERCLLI